MQFTPPALSHAVHGYQSFRRQDCKRHVSSGPIDDEPCFVSIVSSPTGEIVSVNDPADAVYDVAIGDTLEKLALSADSIHKLQQTVMTPMLSARPCYLLLHRDVSKAPVIVRATSTADGVRIDTTDISWSADVATVLRLRYDLSLAEMAVLDLFVEGFTPDEIAQARSCSITTVRSQQRALFDKLQVNSMGDLIRIALGLTTYVNIVLVGVLEGEPEHPNDIRRSVLDVINTEFKVSGAETEIAMMLSIGRSPTVIADTRNSSIRTVRTQINSILKKLTARNIPELIRLIYALMIIHTFPTDPRPV